MKKWLDKYQVKGEVSRDKGVLTYQSNPEYFDNKAVYHDNAKYNDLIRSRVYAGTHGYNPQTGELVKLDKPVAVPESTRLMASEAYGKANKSSRAAAKYVAQTPAEREADAVKAERDRRRGIAEDMSTAMQNPYFRGAIPTMLLSGLPALGEAAYAGLMASPVGAATSAALSSSVAPGLTYGTLGQGLFDSYWASQAATQNIPTAVENFRSGDTKEGLINTGMAAMNLLPFTAPPIKQAAEAAIPYINAGKSKVKNYFTPRQMEMDWNTGEYFQTGKKNAGDVLGELSDKVRQAAYAKQGSKYQFGKEDLPMRVASEADLKRLNEIEEAVSLTAYGMDDAARTQAIQNIASKSSLTDDELMMIYGKNRNEILSHPKDQPLIQSKYDSYGSSIYADTNPLLNAGYSSMGWREVPQKLTTSELKKYYKGISSKPEASIHDAQEIVPHLAAYQFKNKRHMLTSLKEALDTRIKDAKVGDLLIGSTNTSYNSWLPQMDFIFKNAGKNGLSKPVFLGYQGMNQMGFITDAATRGVKIRPTVFMDYLTKGLNTIQKRSPIGLDLQKHPPFVDPNTGGVMLPMYGVRKIDNTFTNIKKRDGGWLSSYDSMTPAWSKNPEGNWVVKAQTGTQVPANLPWINQQGQFTQVPAPQPKNIERRVDEYLDYPQQKARDLASWAAGDNNDEVDNLRHPAAAMYTTEALGSSTGAGMLANGLGAAHEMYVLPQTIKNEGWYNGLRSTAEDMFNNAVGAGVGMIPFLPTETKESLLIYLSDNNMLPDGVSMAEGDMYWKKKSGGESQGEGYYDYINGYSGIFAKGGTKGWLDNYK